jgi:hypothetical protein
MTNGEETGKMARNASGSRALPPAREARVSPHDSEEAPR